MRPMDMHSTFLPLSLHQLSRRRERKRDVTDTRHATRYYCLSILDKHHHPDITLEQGLKILTMCADELKRRLPIDFKGLIVKAIKADGIVDIDFDNDVIIKSA